ncbi:MAG TPA: hypothetical protein P5322_13590, partial [Spirochaetota bacterium]|nr:hypothetical protein [Spirochaetota bacterium]
MISCSQAAFKAANDEPTTTTIPKVKAPTFSVESGTKFKSSILVDINCSTRDAVIRYSYDNVNWVIGTILLISETKTVYAKATKDGMIDSDVVSAIYICTAVSTTTSTSVKTSTTINAYGSTTTSTIDAYGSTTTSTIDAYGSTTTSTIDTYGSTTIDAYATSTTSSSTSTTTTTINQTDYIA